MEMVFHLGTRSVQKAIRSVIKRMCGSGGNIHSFCAMYSLRISFCTVPVSFSEGTPCFSPTTMYMASRIEAGALMVMEVEISSSLIRSKSISISCSESMATPQIPTSPRESG
jgi:hypothetical protein